MRPAAAAHEVLVRDAADIGLYAGYPIRYGTLQAMSCMFHFVFVFVLSSAQTFASDPWLHQQNSTASDSPCPTFVVLQPAVGPESHNGVTPPALPDAVLFR